jgi:hypothetical protein
LRSQPFVKLATLVDSSTRLLHTLQVSRQTRLLAWLPMRSTVRAIQYTPAGTSITLSADSATVIIADDGPEIAAHAAASLFERFRRGPNASGPGAGLGLDTHGSDRSMLRRRLESGASCGPARSLWRFSSRSFSSG